MGISTADMRILCSVPARPLIQPIPVSQGALGSTQAPSALAATTGPDEAYAHGQVEEFTGHCVRFPRKLFLLYMCCCGQQHAQRPENVVKNERGSANCEVSGSGQAA